jgi:hypothetical protein
LFVEPRLTETYRSLQACSDPLWVPAGEVYLYYLNARAAPRDNTLVPPVEYVVPGPCPAYGLARFFDMTDFYLDTDEVSPDCYEACVAEGVCPPAPPRDALRRGLYVDRESAEAFCAFRGGRLPTYAQLQRAAGADSISLGQPELMRQWVDCAANATTPDGCAALYDRAPPLTTAYEQGATWLPREDPADLGPFGHYDLFGGQVERTRSRLPFDPVNGGNLKEELCTAEIVDPVDLGDRAYALYSPALSVRWTRYPEVFQRDNTLGFGAELYPGFESEVEEWSHLEFWTGFRCAYDAEPPEEAWE